MSRKDYIAFAKAIAQITSYDDRRKTAELIAGILAENNPRFSWGKFLQACNV